VACRRTCTIDLRKKKLEIGGGGGETSNVERLVCLGNLHGAWVLSIYRKGACRDRGCATE